MHKQILFGSRSLNYAEMGPLHGKAIDKMQLADGEIVITFQDGTFAAFCTGGDSDDPYWKSMENLIPYQLVGMGGCTVQEWNDSWAAHVESERAANIAARRAQYEQLKQEFENVKVD